MCPFDYRTVAVSGKGWDPVSRFNHTSWVSIVTPTDRPKSVRNRCVIEVFGVVFVLTSCCVLDVSVGVGAFIIRLSQISSFFSPNQCLPNVTIKMKVNLWIDDAHLSVRLSTYC